MKNIIDYVRASTESFLERPFNSVDSLVLAQLVMLRFEHFISDRFVDKNKATTLAALAKRSDVENLFLEVWHNKNARLLFAAAEVSPRFGSVVVRFFVNRIDPEVETQFNAVVFSLPDGRNFIAYRGTDSSLVGWKEDFNMAFISPVPSQVDGLNYLLKWAGHSNSDLRMGGHSKGGNIAVFAAALATEEVQDRIVKIYNHDGPGFLADFYEKPGYERIRHKIDKMIPQSSIVGLLLENQDDYLTVKNVYPWFIQHNPFTWELAGEDFAYRSAPDKAALQRAKAISSWLATMDDKARQVYIDSLYEIIRATEATSFFELTDDWQKRAKAMLHAMKELDDETKSFLKESIGSFFHMAAVSRLEITQLKE